MAGMAALRVFVCAAYAPKPTWAVIGNDLFGGTLAPKPAFRLLQGRASKASRAHDPSA
jgi:hypothetical protein